MWPIFLIAGAVGFVYWKYYFHAQGMDLVPGKSYAFIARANGTLLQQLDNLGPLPNDNATQMIAAYLLSQYSLHTTNIVADTNDLTVFRGSADYINAVAGHAIDDQNGILWIAITTIGG